MDVAGRERVLDRLVGRDSEPRFLVRELTEPFGLGEAGGRHRFADSIDTRLIEACEPLLGLVRRIDEVPRLLYRLEVLVVRHDRLTLPAR